MATTSRLLDLMAVSSWLPMVWRLMEQPLFFHQPASPFPPPSAPCRCIGRGAPLWRRAQPWQIERRRQADYALHPQRRINPRSVSADDQLLKICIVVVTMRPIRRYTSVHQCRPLNKGLQVSLTSGFLSKLLWIDHTKKLSSIPPCCSRSKHRISSRGIGKTMVDASLDEIMIICGKITWLWMRILWEMLHKKAKVEFYPIVVMGVIVLELPLPQCIQSTIGFGSALVTKVPEHASCPGPFIQATLLQVGAPDNLMLVITESCKRRASETFKPVTLELYGCSSCYENCQAI